MDNNIQNLCLLIRRMLFPHSEHYYRIFLVMVVPRGQVITGGGSSGLIDYHWIRLSVCHWAHEHWSMLEAQTETKPSTKLWAHELVQLKVFLHFNIFIFVHSKYDVINPTFRYHESKFKFQKKLIQSGLKPWVYSLQMLLLKLLNN